MAHQHAPRVQAHASHIDHSLGGHPWKALGIVTLCMTGVDGATSACLFQLEMQGAPLVAQLALPATFLSLTCEAMLLICSALFAAWASKQLKVKQLALLAFSFVSTAAVAAWRTYEAITLLRKGRAPLDSVLRVAPLPATYSLDQLVSALKSRASAQSIAPASSATELALAHIG